MLRFLVFAITSVALLLVPVSLGLAKSPSPAPTESTPVIIEAAYEKVNPNGGFAYVQKRLGEKIKLFFLFSAESKESFYKELANRRLAELKYVIDNKDMSNFEKATIRYSSTIGMWTEFILDKQLIEEKQPAVEVLTKHLPVVEELMTRYDGATAEWRFVKQDLDYLRIYIDRLQQP